MVLVTKKITRGASLYGQTDAVGDLERVKATGFMPCGSGDDYVLSKADRAIVQAHQGDGDLELPPGPMGRQRKARPIK